MHLFSRDHSTQFGLRIPFAQRLQPDTLLLSRATESDLPALSDGIACAGDERQQRVKVRGLLYQRRVNGRAQQVAPGGPGTVAQPALVAVAAAFGISITESPCSRQIRSLSRATALPEPRKSRNFPRQSIEVELSRLSTQRLAALLR